eukprot:scaffold707_cov240-Pinguiococcus_pyrenoidosus.AAC.20
MPELRVSAAYSASAAMGERLTWRQKSRMATLQVSIWPWSVSGRFCSLLSSLSILSRAPEA